MKNKRLRKYLEQRAARKREQANKESVQTNPDKHIDQDFPGFPHAPAEEEVIHPRTRQEKKVAAVDVKDGEKEIETPAKKRKKQTGSDNDEIKSDGSASAFEGTEKVEDD